MSKPNKPQQVLTNQIQKILTKPNVKIALLSDIHANLHALRTVLDDAEKHQVDIFINAGDSIGFGPYPNEVLEVLFEKKVLSVLGNFDLEVIEEKTLGKGEKSEALKFTRKVLTDQCQNLLSLFPHELRLNVAGKKLIVTHGSPESIEEHIYHDTPIERLNSLAEVAKADLIIIGHSHEQFVRETNGTFFVNPGSIGRPDDGNPQAAYAILSFNPINIKLIRLDYDVEAAARALRKKGLPESLSQMLLRGVSLEKIIQEDKKKEKETAQNCTLITKDIAEVSKKYWPDNEHFIQVSKLGLELFDKLQKLHNLGVRERCWLECAIILHDIGLSESRGSHHKKTAKLIMNDTRLPFTSEERRIIASIARYHRKAFPKQSHYILAPLDRPNIKKVRILSSLLRVADSLDYTHQSIVEEIEIKVGTKKITLSCASKIISGLEEQAFNKKKGLFEKVFAKELVLKWKQL